MRELYKALALIAVDKTVREAVVATTGFVLKPALKKEAACMPDPTTDLEWEKQPNLDGLRAMDKVFRPHGLFLTAYDLAEVNRWIAKHTDDFIKVLDEFRDGLPEDVRNALEGKNLPLLESVGVMIVDPELRDRVRKGDENLTDSGFRISPVEEERIREIFASGGGVDLAADKIRAMGWSGSCASRQSVYDSMFHFNM
jgi:hypothetical protein